MHSETIPRGYCQCGCGGKAPIASSTHRARGYVKDEPRRYISGHNGTHRPFEPLEDRYEVRDCGYVTPCWVWLRSFSRRGYGRMWSPTLGRVTQASRFYYEHFVGPIPDGLQIDHSVPSSLQIDHLCRNRICVNPEHLEPVTQETNQRRGLNAKLTDEMRAEMRVLREQGWGYRRLARRYHVSEPTIANAIKRDQH